MAKFNPGDVVELKSGGPVMTVKAYNWNVTKGAYEEDRLVCTWFDKDQKLQSATFPETNLKVAEPDAFSGEY